MNAKVEVQQQGELQEVDANHPVEFTGRLVRTVIEDAGHMEEHREHHQVGRPSVHIPDQQAEGHAVLQRVDVIPGRCGGRPVEEHQEDAGDRQQDEQEEGQTAEAQRVADLDGVTLHLHRVQVV